MKLMLYYVIKWLYKKGLCSCMMLLICIGNTVLAQDSQAAENEKASFTNFDTKTIEALNKQYSKLQQNVEKQSRKMLERIMCSEAKLQKKLNGIDSLKAAGLFNVDIQQQYTDFQNELCVKIDTSVTHLKKQYIAGLDSVQTSLNFLQSGDTKVLSVSTDKLKQYKALSSHVQELQRRMQEASDIQSFIRERESSLTEQLRNTGLSKQLTSINKEAFYYQARLSEYKDLLNDNDKLKDKLLSAIREIPAFKEFWRRNSMLAQLFPMPANYGTPQALEELQSRSNIQGIIAQRIGSAAGQGISSQQYFQQQTNAAQAQLNQLKDKLTNLGSGSGSGDMTMPDFKPNNQHTKSFMQRLQYGFNVQSQPGTGFLPATTDFAVTAGYKFDDKKVVGIGASYKMGWGSGFKNITITNQGLSLRSFVDIKAKGSLWISGGLEYNYLQAFSSYNALKNVDTWQRSVLAGITKRYTIGKKTNNIQLLYDFLHNQQVPPSQGIKFRVGYTFK